MATTLALNELKIIGYSVIDDTVNAIMAAWIPGHKYHIQFELRHTKPNSDYWFDNIEVRIECNVAGVAFYPQIPPSQLAGHGHVYQSQRFLLRNGESQNFIINIQYNGSQPRAVSKDFDIGIYAFRYKPSSAWKKFGPV